jgi:hypothetical protein
MPAMFQRGSSSINGLARASKQLLGGFVVHLLVFSSQDSDKGERFNGRTFVKRFDEVMKFLFDRHLSLLSIDVVLCDCTVCRCLTTRSPFPTIIQTSDVSITGRIVWNGRWDAGRSCNCRRNR